MTAETADNQATRAVRGCTPFAGSQWTATLVRASSMLRGGRLSDDIADSGQPFSPDAVWLPNWAFLSAKGPGTWHHPTTTFLHRQAWQASAASAATSRCTIRTHCGLRASHQWVVMLRDGSCIVDGVSWVCFSLDRRVGGSVNEGCEDGA
jgi:hypothetical protein